MGGEPDPGGRGEPEIESAASPPANTISDDGDEDRPVTPGAPSDAPLPSGTLTPTTGDTVRLGPQRHPVLPAGSATLAEHSRSQSPVLVAEASSSRRTEPSTAQPTTPKLREARNILKRERPGDPVVKEEPGDGNDGLVRTPRWDARNRSSPVKREEDDNSSDDDEDDDDVVEVSPFKRPRGPRDQEAAPALAYLGAFRRRSDSPSPLPPPDPLYHPDFPDRPALKCPRAQRGHADIVCETSRSQRNAGREYYRCLGCGPGDGFICWADGRGVRPDNPRCHCGHASREDITGFRSLQPGTLWYKCATDACGFRRFDWDDPLTQEEADAYCGLEVHRF
ncbi:hypothetical protein DL764_005721 [Monosporascus ibericus]|uniref:GRF-like zinc ribbon domain-containing protein n=1 Tax=Monosporascus ibericus TaxID=155417 RepID=A0A4Q4T7W2_9PEZI|nr:hypothetical protein DL764_005721 [Monosporascus ibericus]